MVQHFGTYYTNINICICCTLELLLNIRISDVMPEFNAVSVTEL